MGLFLCILAFVAGLLLGRRSLVAGLGGVLTAGYFYGIARANFPDSYSHFIFDAAVTGFYLALVLSPPRAARAAYMRPLTNWVKVLVGWSVVMFLVPVQHMLIQLVGLRGNAFLLPFLLVGGWLSAADARKLAGLLAALNVVALGFGATEYVIGIKPFYPMNAVTELLYRCGDVAGGTAYRIPACFANAASYGGTMVVTVPWLAGAWGLRGKGLWRTLLLLGGLGGALAGTFMCASRSPVIILAILVVAVTLSGKLRGASLLGWVVLLAVVVWVVVNEERFQRFTTLTDVDAVAGRLHGSINMSFVELLITYPMGNGMGGGGTSIPFFLHDLLTDPIGLESEYSRILLEQGIVGLCLWVGFVGWVALRRPTDRKDPWHFGRRLLWVSSLTAFATGMIGTGMLTSIP
ncbi:MAG TPA: hypothetical protein VFW33_04100, partial [Gemmataceae bacterium]|nr:hypothetical protein [Gemmataceae bacterium]